MTPPSKTITVEVDIHAPIEAVWDSWINPQHIVQWCFASDDWEAPRAENDVRVGGKCNTRMQAKDGSAGFDFEWTYTNVIVHECLEYDIVDGRHVRIEFNPIPDGVRVVETFDMEQENSEDLQRAGWQSILNNFKQYVEQTPVSSAGNLIP
jgi:uncharacterized protein YndB with AHSA1/START domain